MRWCVVAEGRVELFEVEPRGRSDRSTASVAVQGRTTFGLRSSLLVGRRLSIRRQCREIGDIETVPESDTAASMGTTVDGSSLVVNAACCHPTPRSIADERAKRS